MNKAADARSTMFFWVYLYHRDLLSGPRFVEVKTKNDCAPITSPVLWPLDSSF